MREAAEHQHLLRTHPPSAGADGQLVFDERVKTRLIFYARPEEATRAVRGRGLGCCCAACLVGFIRFWVQRGDDAMLGAIKYKKKKSSGSSDSGGGKVDGTPVEGAAAPSSRRDDWMTKPMQSNSVTVRRKEAAEREVQDRARAAEAAKEAEAKAMRERHVRPARSDVLVGDGGASWRRRALKRARERAREEGRAEGEVIREVWGSKNRLLGMNGGMRRPRGEGLRWGKKGNRSRSPRGDRRDGGERPRRDGDRRRAYDDRSRTWRRSSRSPHRRRHDDRRASDRQSDRRRRPRDAPEAQRPATSTSRPPSSTEGTDSILRRAKAHAQRNQKEIQDSQAQTAFLYGSQPKSKGTPDEPTGSKPKATTGKSDPPVEDGRSKAQIEAEANRLAAKAMRAKLQRKTEKYNEYMRQAEALRAQAARVGGPAKTEPSVRILSQVDFQGRRIPMGSAATEDGPPPAKRARRPANKIAADGKRAAYFDRDLEKTSLRDLVEQERTSQANDYDSNWARHVVNSGAKFRAGDTDEQFDMADVTMQQYESKANRLRDTAARAKHERQRAIQQHNRMERILTTCWFCLESPKRLKHMAVSYGVKCYLALASRRRVADGQCLIIPMEHTVATTQADESVQEEITFFKRHLVKMFAAQGRGCVFLETVLSMQRQRHTTVECIPVPREALQEAPIYFKKAILESDEEWSVNRKLIDTRERGLWRSVPKNFPYFSVEFGLGGGFAHVIEDETKFRDTWGLEILCGVLGEPAQIVLRARRPPVAVERTQVDAFKKAWKKYDWTRKLKGGDLYAKDMAARKARAAEKDE